MKLLKKVLKIAGILAMVLSLGFYWAFSNLTAPITDDKILDFFKESNLKPVLSKEKYKDFIYRKLSTQKDSTLPTLVFVHGTIGSCVDFASYMNDSLLLTKVNMVSYDRVGYNYKDKKMFKKVLLLNVIC